MVWAMLALSFIVCCNFCHKLNGRSLMTTRKLKTEDEITKALTEYGASLRREQKRMDERWQRKQDRRIPSLDPSNSSRIQWGTPFETFMDRLCHKIFGNGSYLP